MNSLLYTSFLSLLLLAFVFAAEPEYRAGAGIWDITGPAADVGMMGYAMLYQRTAGIHFRLRSRAFAIENKATSDLVVYVNLDLCFTTHALKTIVIEKLEKEYPGVFSYENVMLSATHTHAGPGGYSWYSIYDITSFGFNKENFFIIADGITNSIIMAYKNMQDAILHVNVGELADPMSNINRSPTAYMNNPGTERHKYKYDVDKEVVTLRFDDMKGNPFATIAWFPVHGTSMKNLNLLISGDNKGYASYLFERRMNGNFSTGTGKFVAAFGQSNEGDVSPNTRGAYCNETGPYGKRCDTIHSTCDGYSQGCHGYGPGDTDFESTKIIGQQQYEKAWEMFNDKENSVLVKGDVRKVHTFINMTNMPISTKYTGLNNTVFTCVAALGDSFAAGTTDGPGDFNFVQGTNSSDVNPYWHFLSHYFIANPPEEQKKCHYPKPILLYTGAINVPTQWVADILPIQIHKIGNLFIIAVPAEFSTMAGRRLRESIRQKLINDNLAGSDSVFVIAGLANSYSQYVVTTEEYNIQRYEGASTLYGPYTLNYYIQEFENLAGYLVKNKPAPPGITPIDWRYDVVNFLPPHLYDDGPIGKVHTPPNSSYKPGEIASVVFYSGSPRNNPRIQDTFLTVEKLIGPDKWQVIATDGDWETKFHWERKLLFESLATIEWEIPEYTEPGTYRIKHFCEGREGIFDPKIISYVGVSPEFTVEH